MVVMNTKETSLLRSMQKKESAILQTVSSATDLVPKMAVNMVVGSAKAERQTTIDRVDAPKA